MPIFIDCEQYTKQFWDLWLGSVGASRAHMIITPKGKPSIQAKKLENIMFNEIIWHRFMESYSNKRIREGLEDEEDSINYFCMITGIELERIGIVFKDEQRLFHCSPDAHEPEFKLGFETKNAQPNIQAERLENHEKGKSSFLNEHFVQVQMSLYITEYDKWILQSHCKNMPTLTLEVYPDLEFHKKLEAELYKFVGNLQAKVKKYQKGN